MTETLEKSVAIGCLRIEAAHITQGREYGPCLLAPSETGEWTIGAWDGNHWYDVMSGALLHPIVWADLPGVTCVIGMLRRSG